VGSKEQSTIPLSIAPPPLRAAAPEDDIVRRERERKKEKKEKEKPRGPLEKPFL